VATQRSATRTVYQRFVDRHFERSRGRPAVPGRVAPASPAALTITALEVSADTSLGRYRQDLPAVGRLPNRHLVFWRDEQRGPAQIFMRRFDAALLPLNDPTPLFADDTVRAPSALMGASDGMVMLVGVLRDDPEDFMVAFTDDQGSVQSTERVNESSPPGYIAAPTATRLHPNGFFTAWEEFQAGGWHILGQRFETNGSRRGSNRNLDEGLDSLLRFVPAVAGDTAGSYMAAWSEGDQSRGDICVRFFTAGDTARGPATAVTSPSGSESYVLPHAVYVDSVDEYWLVYVCTDEPPDSTTLLLRRFSRVGTVLDSAASLDAGPYPWAPRLAQAGRNVSVFTERLDHSGEIRALTLGPDALPLDTSQVLNDALARERTTIAVTSGFDSVAVLWQDRADGGFDIHGRLMAGAATLSPDLELSTEAAGGPQRDAALAAHSGGVHVVFTDLQNDDGDISLTDVSPDGTILSRRIVNDDGTLALQFDPHIAVDTAGRALVTWTDDRDDWSGPARHVAGRFVQGGGFLGPAFPLAVDTTAGFQSGSDVALSPDGRAVVVWVDNRSALPRAYLRRFDTLGVPEPVDVALNDGSQLTIGTALEQDPAVAADSAGRFWTVWTVLDSLTDSFFVLAQAWDTGGVRRGSNVSLTPTGPGSGPLDFDLLALNSGHVRMVWYDSRPATAGIWTEEYDTAGNASGLLMQLSAAGVYARQPVIASDTEGRWAVAWSQTNGLFEDLLWQRFDAGGAPSGGIERISSDSSASRRRHPGLAYSGAYLFGAWHDNDVPGKGFDVRLSSMLKSTAGVHEDGTVLPERVHLHPNYPNPFNPQTVIEFTLDAPRLVRLEIFDLLGQRVRVLAFGARRAGVHRQLWNGMDDAGRAVGSGVYFCRLQAGDLVRTRKMLLVR
jgi:hypothetical protein